METNNIEPELNSLRTKLSVEIENDSKQVEILRKRIKKNEELLQAIRGSLNARHPENKTTGYGSKSQIVWTAIEALGKPRFTQDDVEAELQRASPEMDINRNRIRSILWKFAAKDKKIKLIRRGNNRQLAEFEKIEGVTRYRRIPKKGEKEQLQLTIEALREYLTQHNARKADLAHHFGVNKTVIEELINNDGSGIELHGKGWLKLKQ